MYSFSWNSTKSFEGKKIALGVLFWIFSIISFLFILKNITNIIKGEREKIILIISLLF